MAGGRTGAYWLAASAMSRTSSLSTSVPGVASKVSTSSDGGSVETSVKRLVNAGVAAPAYTSTSSGTADSRPVQMSTRSMLDNGDGGRTRRPSATSPATRRDGSTDTSRAVTPRSSRSASTGGTRSPGRGSRMSGSRLKVAFARS